jgi:signal transduction histidine kinase
MNWQTPRRRLQLSLLAALVVGGAVNMALYDVAYSRTVERSVNRLCDLTGSLSSNACVNRASDTLRYVCYIAVAAVLWPVLSLMVSWLLRPVRDLVPVIDQVGPQNLGYRIRKTGGRKDDFAELCRAVDDMMDRIMAGYEGQRRFAANASHELRTPLAVQRTLVEVGMTQPLTSEQFALLSTQLLQANERNERLIEGLLVLSEADQGLVSSLPQRLDRIAASVVATHQSAATAADVRLTEGLEARVVHGEQVLLERLVTNLVQNAIKYNRPNGTIHVTVGRSPALTVANTGQLVPPDAVAGLFEPFKRLAGDRIDHSGGVGLGLAIARSITRAHEGTITAAALDGGGLRVEVQFPDPLTPVTPGKPGKPGSAPGRPPDSRRRPWGRLSAGRHRS